MSQQLSLGRPSDTARFSKCGTYRFSLTRELGGTRTLGIIGLNPSVATADKDDPTIRKECGFAKRWECGRLVKGNANAYIATDPDDMMKAHKRGVDVIGGLVGNDMAIIVLCADVVASDGILLVAWGANLADYPGRQEFLAKVIAGTGAAPMCLGTNKDGSPVHPLYIPYTRELRKWECPA